MPARELLGAERKRFESRYRKYGFGDPSTEGGVDAPIGCEWIRLDGGLGGMLYIKYGLLRTEWYLSSTAPLGVVLGDNHLRFRRELQIVKNPGLATVTPVGLPAPTLTGGANADATDGTWVAMTTSGALGAVAGMQNGSTTHVGRLFTWGGEAIFLVKTDGTVSSLRFWVGLANTSGGAALAITSTPGSGQEVAAFRFATDVDGTFFWRCVTHDGSVGPPTVSATGVAVASNTIYKLYIVADGSSIDFYINEVLVATHTTTLPGSGTILAHQESVTALIASPRTLRFSRAAFLFK